MTYILICVIGFFAAMVDSMVGGGGLISLPALIATGMPTHLALGTNKFASGSGAISSSLTYIKSGNVSKRLMKVLFPCSLIGSAIGVKVVLGLNPDFLKAIIIFLVAIIGIYTLMNKELGLTDNYVEPDKIKMTKGVGLAGFFGFYDGFFGPGTGSFLIFGLIHIFGLDFKRAAANAKVLNLASNLMAAVIFLFSGQVAFQYGVPMAISMIIGAKVGAHFAIKGGSKFIKPIFVIVSFVLVVKMGTDLIM